MRFILGQLSYYLITSIYQPGTEIKGISDTIAMIVDTIHFQYQQIKMKIKDPNYKETLVTSAHRETLDTRVSMEVIVTSKLVKITHNNQT